jgi:hypothetical protein
MRSENLEINLLNNASFTSYLKEMNQLNFNGSLSVYESLVAGAFGNFGFTPTDWSLNNQLI